MTTSANVSRVRIFPTRYRLLRATTVRLGEGAKNIYSFHRRGLLAAERTAALFYRHMIDVREGRDDKSHTRLSVEEMAVCQSIY
jgi:hypothetical protein